LVDVKAKFDDHVITLRQIELPDGTILPSGTHGFVIEAFSEPEERYELEFDPKDSGEVLHTVGPDDFGVA